MNELVTFWGNPGMGPTAHNFVVVKMNTRSQKETGSVEIKPIIIINMLYKMNTRSQKCSESIEIKVNGC